VDSATRESAYPGDLLRAINSNSFRRGENVSLPALLAFVDIGIKVDIGYETVKHRTSGLDHTIRKLGAHAHRVSTGEFSEE
jgi:allantoicase